MDLTETVARLEKMAPLSLADSWDNVGLLIEPSAPHKVARCLLTNDLTEPVMQEALASKVCPTLSHQFAYWLPTSQTMCWLRGI